MSLKFKLPGSSRVPVGFAFVNFNETGDLASSILKSLPPRSDLWSHVSRFFKYIYPFYLIIDEKVFRKSIETIIGSDGHETEKVTRLSITTKEDYSNIGLLLIILRLSYLTLCVDEETWAIFIHPVITHLNMRSFCQIL